MLSQAEKAGGFLEFRRQRSRLLPGGWARPFLSRCPGCLGGAKTKGSKSKRVLGTGVRKSRHGLTMSTLSPTKVKLATRLVNKWCYIDKVWRDWIKSLDWLHNPEPSKRTDLHTSYRGELINMTCQTGGLMLCE